MLLVLNAVQKMYSGSPVKVLWNYYYEIESNDKSYYWENDSERNCVFLKVFALDSFHGGFSLYV